MTTWTIDTGWVRPPLSMNDSPPGGRRAIFARARQKREIKEHIWKLVHQAAIPPLAHATVRMMWIVPDRRKRDTDNPWATGKVCCDALVGITLKNNGASLRLPGILPDDSPLYMTKHMPEIVYRKGETGVQLIIEGTPK